MDKKNKILINDLNRYKALHYLTNKDIGLLIGLHETAVCKLFRGDYKLSEAVRFRVEDLLEHRESVKVVSDKSNQQQEEACVQHDKPSKIRINAEIKKKLIDKIAHKSPKVLSR
jgi:hypothetical protein